MADLSVLAIGDLMLDVVVRADRALAADDDIEASILVGPGGQATNVAVWCTALGGRAALLTPHQDDEVGALMARELERRGVRLLGEPGHGRSGAVVSWSGAGVRTMASDPGERSWVASLRTALESSVDPVDWVVISGYCLLRLRDVDPLLELVASYRRTGARVVVDLASASLIQSYDGGPHRVAARLTALAPDLVVGNDTEWDLMEPRIGALGGARIRKHGAGGATFSPQPGSGIPETLPAAPGDVVDTTGAGDALLAGYLMGGPQLAMATAARCIASPGSLPA